MNKIIRAPRTVCSGIIITLLALGITSILVFQVPPGAMARELSLSGTRVPPEFVVWKDSIACIELGYICKNTGAQYMYVPESQILVVYKTGKAIQMQIGNRDVWVDQRFCRLQTPIQIIDGKVMVPFRDLALVLGGEPGFTDEKKDRSIPGHVMGRTVAEGVRYDRYRISRPSGPAVVHVASIDLDAPDLELRSVLAREKMTGRETVSEMSRKQQALIGLNGSFFSKEGNPMGMVITDHQLVSVPIMSRTVFGITDTKQIVFGNPRFRGRVRFDDNRVLELDGVNRQGKNDSIVLYTPEFGDKTPTCTSCKEVALLGNKVVAIGSGNLIIPPGGVVISASGNKAAALADVEIWKPASINFGLGSAWNDVEEAVGGGPRLVAGGEVRITGLEERFRKDVLEGRAPRSAVGINGDNKLLLVAVDGRQPGYSSGMTLQELACFLIEIGATDAMNLDGGGSTSFVLDGQVVNSPSDGEERPVGSALLICRKTSHQLASRLLVDTAQ